MSTENGSRRVDSTSPHPLETKIARERCVSHIDSQVNSALSNAHIGTLYKPFADAPGAIDASPATWWDYFWAELSPVPVDAYRASAKKQASGQTSLTHFERVSDETMSGECNVHTETESGSQ